MLLSRPRRRAAVLSGGMLCLPFLGVMLLTGCGGDRSGGPQGTPTDVVLGAIDHTQALGTAKFQIGVGEVAAGTGQVVWQVVPAGSAGAPSVVVTRVTLSLHPVRAAVAAGSGTDDVIVIGGTGYVRGPVTGGQWVTGPAAELSRRFDATAPAVAEVLARPGAGLALDTLRGASSVQTYGGAEVQGSSTLRYTVRVDPNPAANAAAGPTASVLQAEVGEQAGSYPSDVWVDGRLRILRVQLPQDPKATVTTQSEDRVTLGVTTLDLMDFGAPVTIDAPAGAQPAAG